MSVSWKMTQKKMDERSNYKDYSIKQTEPLKNVTPFFQASLLNDD